MIEYQPEPAARSRRHLRLIPGAKDASAGAFATDGLPADGSADTAARPSLARVTDSTRHSPHPSFPGFSPAPAPDVSGLDPRDSSLVSELAPAAWSAAARCLGTDYAAGAFVDAERLVRRSPQLLRRSRPRTWAAAIVWTIAVDEQIVGRDFLTPARLARELGSTVPTLRAKSAELRAALR